MNNTTQYPVNTSTDSGLRRMWLPILYVCITMVTAVVGNCLVLAIFSCRWRSTGATKIYVLSLAALDLTCALISTPRELLPLLYLIKLDSMDMFCRILTSAVYSLSLSSCLILVIISITRYLKVTDEDQGLSLKAKVIRGTRAITTVKGAKVAVTVTLGFSVAMSWPVPVVLQRDPDTNCMCYVSCFAGTGENPSLQTFNVVLFLVFIAVVLVMLTCYGAILRLLWRERKQRKRLSGQAGLRSSAVYCSRQCGSLGTLIGPAVSLVGRGGAICRTMSEGDATAARKGSKKGATTTRHTSNPFTRREIDHIKNQGLVRRNLLLFSAMDDGNDITAIPPPPSPTDPTPTPNSTPEPAPVPGPEPAESDWRNCQVDTNRMTYFPPVSYSAQLRSLLSLDMARTDWEGEEACSLQRQLSVMSFQFHKRGDLTHQTTLVFFVVTVILVVSYLPFFVVLKTVGADERCGGCSGSVLDMLVEVAARSYLLAYAANPVVYGLCNPVFRRTLKKCLTCRTQVI